MRRMKKILKALMYIVILIVVSSILISQYISYKDNKYNEEQLSFGALKDEKWSWQDKFNNIQIRKFKEGDLHLRQVDLGKEQYSIISISKDHRLNVISYFKVDCKPETNIEIGSTYILFCDNSGKWLMSMVSTDFQVDWSKRYGEFNLVLDRGVFRAELSIPYASLALLEREYILNKAIPN